MQHREQGLAEEHEFRFIAKDGSHVCASLSACAITLPEGQPGALAMVRDVTEQKQLLDQLQEARKLEAIGRLAGGVAHDFNNLLTAILTSITLAERDPTGLALHLQTIRGASERAASLTKQLLAFARKQVVQLRPLHPSAVVRDLTSVLQSLVAENIDLVMDLASETWPVLADPSQLEQVLVNLVANARDAMPEGGRVVISTRNVTLDATKLQSNSDVKPGEYVVLAVRDTGKGIDANTRPHIFEPFFTTKQHGTGLGLASCYGIAKQLGGHIWVTSAADGGTLFEVCFPRCLELPRKSVPPPKAPFLRGHETLLIVEDDALVRDTLQRALRKAGYSVLAARDGEHALKLAREYPGTIPLLITDMVMPRLSGRQLVDELEPLLPNLKVLFVSGYLDQIALPEHGQDASREFLAKPYTLDDLLLCLRKLLDR
jgi:two-component system cell cycle sensor histidine kinase/response regulator CckA